MLERFVGSCVDRSKLRLNWKPTDCNSLNDKNSRYFWLRNDSSFAVIDSESNSKLVEHHFHSNNESSSKIICIESCFLQIDHSKPSTSFNGNDQKCLSENDRVASNDINEKFGLYVAVRHKATSKKQEFVVLHCFNLESGCIVSSLELDFEPTNILVLKDARFRQLNLRICRSFVDFAHIILIGSKFGKLILCNPDWSSPHANEQENVLEPFEMENLVDLPPDWDPKIAFRIDILHFAKNCDFFSWSSFNNRFNIPLKDVAISSLFLLNTANFIIVGFNIGTFMIMSTLNFQPLFFSEYGSLKMPVRKFEYQEPENDPRAILYLWVVRQLSSRVHVELHQMCFSDESAHHSYEKFEFCVSRFNFSIENCTQVLSAQTLEIQASGHDVTLSDDHVVDRNLFYIMWLAGDSSVDETGRYFTKSSANKRLKGALFDLNGWYYAQMPRRFDLHGERQFSAPKNRRQVDFLIVHDYGCLSCSDECCLAVKTMSDCVERCHYDNAAVYASSIGLQSILVTDDKFYDLQIYNLKRQAFNYILYWGKPFTEDCWLQINEILNNGTMNDLQYPADEFSFHLVKEQICDSLLSDRNCDVLIKLVSILTSADSNNDVFGQWLWRKSIELKTEFDEHLIAALQNEDNFNQLLGYKRDIQNLSLLFDEWIDVARFKFEDSAKNVIDAKKDVFSLVKSYIDMTAFFCRDELKYLTLTANKNIVHSKTALYNSKSLTILCARIKDIDLLPESFFHLMNVYLRPELNPFSQNFLIYYIFLSILNKLPDTDDVEAYRSSLQYYCDEILPLLDENFQSVVEFVYNREQNKTKTSRKCCNFELILQKCALDDWKFDDIESEKLTTEQLKLESIKLVNTAKENELFQNTWQNLMRIYYDKIGMDWLKSPLLNDDILLDYDRYFESNAKTYFSNLLNDPVKSKLKRKSPEPRFLRQMCAKGNNSQKMRNLDNIPTKIDVENVSKVKMLPSTPFLRKQFRKLDRQCFAREKGEPSCKKSKFDTPKITKIGRIDSRGSASTFKFDPRTKSVHQLQNLLNQEDFQKVINSPLLIVENFRRKLSALDTTTTSRSFVDQRNSFLGSSSLNFSPASSPKPRKSILIDTSISSSARRSNNMTNVKECALIKKFRFDLDELFAQDKSEKVYFEENEDLPEKSIVPSDQSKILDEMSLDHDRDSTKSDHDPELTVIDQDRQSTEVEHDRQLTEVDHDQKSMEIDPDRLATKVGHNHISHQEFAQVEDDQTGDEQSVEVEPTNEDFNQTCVKKRTLVVESFEASLASISDVTEAAPNFGHKSDETLVINEAPQIYETDENNFVPENDALIPEIVANVVEIETSLNTDDDLNPKIPSIFCCTVENFEANHFNDHPPIESRKNTAVEVVDGNLESEQNENQVQHHYSPKKSCDQGIQTSFVVVCLPKSNNSNGEASENKNLTALKSVEEFEKKVEADHHKQTKNTVEEQQPSVSASPNEPVKRRTQSLRSEGFNDDSINANSKPGSPRRKSERISTRILRSAKRNDDKAENPTAFAEKLRTISRRTDPKLRHMRLAYNLRNKYKDKSSA